MKYAIWMTSKNKARLGLPAHLMTVAVLLGLLLVTVSSANAQVGSLRVGMSSPTAASLGKFGDIPVSLYTGTPNISIPLYEVKGRTLSVPISLAYHASGIRVEEIPGWVGMGWALNAGGVITRTVRGLPDDSNDGYPITRGPVEALAANPNPTPTEIQELVDDIEASLVDPEPDQFFFNMAGRSGQFVFGDVTDETLIRSAPYQKLKFEFFKDTLTPPLSDAPFPTPQLTVVTRWTVTTEDGTKYIFGDLPETTSEYEGLEWTWNETEGVSCGTGAGDGCIFISSWYLTRIESPHGDDQITFSYFAAPDDVVHKHLAYTEDLIPLTPACFGETAADYVTNYTHTRSLWLEKIEAATESVLFDLELRDDAKNARVGGPREGDQQERLLREIQVVDPIQETHIKKTFWFDYSYLGTQDANRRLRLDAVAEQDPAGSLPDQEHQFGYNTSGVLPAFTSNDIDHWGYYNGANNSTRLPAIEADLTASGFGIVNLLGADREPSPAEMQYGMLQTITYPTGGITTFTFEPHGYGYIRNQQAPAFEYGPWQEKAIELPGIQPIPDTYAEQPFTVQAYDGGTRTVDIHTHLKITGRPLGGLTITCGNDPGFDLCVRIEDSQGNLIFRQTESPNDDGAACTIPSNLSNPLVGDRDEEFTVTCALPDGNYKLIGEISEGCTSAQDCLLDADVTWRNTSPSNGRIAGGLRVQKVEHDDGLANTPNVVMNYEYEEETTGWSSGVAVIEPRYHYVPQVVLDPSISCDYLSRSATSVAGLGLTQGATVGYKRVVMRPGDPADQGYTEHLFTSAYDINYQDSYSEDDDAWPFALRTSLDYGRGFQTESWVYNQGGDEQHRTLNYRFDSYWDGNIPTTTRAYPAFALRLAALNTGQRSLDFQFTQLYAVVSSWLHPTQEHVTVYDEAGSNSVMSAKNYTYDASDLQLEKLEETNSDGRTRTTEYEYAHERHQTGMANENMLAQLYSQTVSDDNDDVAKQWSTWHLDNGHWRKDEEHVWVGTDGSAPLDPGSESILQATYNTYDDYGRVKQQTDALGRSLDLVYEGPSGNVDDLFLSKVQQDNLDVEYTYYTTGPQWGLLHQTIDENNNTTTYTYDGFRRLASMSNPTGDLLSSFDYHVSTGNVGSDPNYIQTTSHLDASTQVVSRSYFDGLGREYLSELDEGNNSYLVSQTVYDDVGRVVEAWKPYRDEAGYVSGQYDEGEAALDYGAFPYVRTTYLPDPLARVKDVEPEGHTATLTATYSVDVGTNLAYAETTDEANQKARAYTDAFGFQVRTEAAQGTAEEAVTEISYDILGNPITVKPPNVSPSSNPGDWVTTYTYNTRSQLIEKSTPDTDGDHDGNPSEDGEIDYQYFYDDVGNLRFVIDPNRNPQAGNTGYLYTDYDAFNRIIETGRCTSGTPGDPNQATTTCQKEEVVTYTYDAYSLPRPSGLDESNLKGRLTQVAFDDSYYVYFYDDEGRIEHFFIHLDGLDATGQGKLMAYDYDRQGNVTTMGYEVGGSDEVTLSYTYDEAGRLDKVFSKTFHDAQVVQEAHYEDYRATGQVETLQLGPTQIPAFDYQYHIRDWLTQINNPASLGTEPFAMGLTYEVDGNVASMEWATQGNSFEYGSGQSTLHVGYFFDYDNLDRLTEADFQYHDGSQWQNSAAYDVGVGAPITYDDNGNITSLLRLNDQGTGSAIAYQYPTAGSNRLGSVSGGASANFAYDHNGNMTKSRVSDQSALITYERRNLPTTIPLPDGSTLTFRYDDSGQRIYKKLVDSGDMLVEETFYLRGADGSVLTVYSTDDATQAHQLEYWNILSGGAVIGRIVPPAGTQ